MPRSGPFAARRDRWGWMSSAEVRPDADTPETGANRTGDAWWIAAIGSIGALATVVGRTCN